MLKKNGGPGQEEGREGGSMFPHFLGVLSRPQPGVQGDHNADQGPSEMPHPFNRNFPTLKKKLPAHQQPLVNPIGTGGPVFRM